MKQRDSVIGFFVPLFPVFQSIPYPLAFKILAFRFSPDTVLNIIEGEGKKEEREKEKKSKNYPSTISLPRFELFLRTYVGSRKSLPLSFRERRDNRGETLPRYFLDGKEFFPRLSSRRITLYISLPPSPNYSMRNEI